MLSSDGETGSAGFVFKKTCFPFTGSGIYAPHSPRAYHYDMETGLGKILLSEVDSYPRKSPAYPTAVSWRAYATTINPFPVQKNIFRGFISKDMFSFTELFENSGNLTVCHEDFCCHLGYRMLRKEENEVYVLGAFTGLHGRRRREYWQVISAPVKGSVSVSLMPGLTFCICPTDPRTFSRPNSMHCQY